MKTYIVILNDRSLLEKVENQIFENVKELIAQLKSWGMTEEQENGLGYYSLSMFMDLVNDQVLDNLEGTFIGYVRINK